MVLNFEFERNRTTGVEDKLQKSGEARE